jgi:hypothetical protein
MLRKSVEENKINVIALTIEELIDALLSENFEDKFSKLLTS